MLLLSDAAQFLLFFLLRGDEFLAALFFLLGMMQGDGPSTDPIDSTFIKEVDFMFPKDFLSRYPHEADPFRLKIFGYLVCHLLVKGHAKRDPSKAWAGYNRAEFYRIAVDAVFYEYLTNFTDSREDKDALFNPLENARSNLSNPVSNEEIAVDRIGQYLDLLSEAESRAEVIKGTNDILSETREFPAMPKHQIAECDIQPMIGFPGLPGIDYPNFCDIPKTSFSCADKKIPGIYADYETGCQAFHVCWPHRRDTFLCPIGTIFNQSLLTCDLWYDAGCFSSPSFQRDHFLIDGISTAQDIPKFDGTCESLLTKPLRLHMKFVPEKCEVKDILGRKVKPRGKDIGEIKARLEMAFDMIKDMLQMLSKMKNELDNIKNPRIILAKHLKSISDFSPETVEEVSEFTRKFGETEFKPPQVAEQASHLETFPSVTRSTLLKPSKSLEEHVKSSRKQDVPDIVMKSMRLGGTILSEGVIPMAKQIMIDSYRKIESKNL